MRNEAAPGLVGSVVLFGLFQGGPQVFQHRRQVGLELLPRLPELLDFREFVVQKAADEAVQLAGPPHVHPHRLVPVLEQDGGLGIFEKDVVPGIAVVKLLLDFGVQVVVGVLGLPESPGHPQGVLHRAVGHHAAGRQLRHQAQLLPVLPAVGVQAVLKGRPDAQLVIRPAEVLQLL